MAKVSVFVPNYNSEKYIRGTIEAILNQTYSDFELVIVDDGSTDGSVDILREYAVKDDRIKLYFNQGNRGVVYTRNRGIELCNGEYIAICDADDISFEDRLEVCVKYLDEKKYVDCIYGNTKAINEDEYICGKDEKEISTFLNKCNKELKDSTEGVEKEGDRIKYEMLFGNEVSNSACMYRSEFRKRYDIKYRDYFCSQDYGFFADFLAAGGHMVKLNRKLTAYRIMSNGITSKSYNRLEERGKIQDEIHAELLKSCKISLSDKMLSVYLKKTRAPYTKFDSVQEGLTLLLTAVSIAFKFKGSVSITYKLKKSIGLWKNLLNMI